MGKHVSLYMHFSDLFIYLFINADAQRFPGGREEGKILQELEKSSAVTLFPRFHFFFSCCTCHNFFFSVVTPRPRGFFAVCRLISAYIYSLIAAGQ